MKKFMKLAFEEANIAKENNEIPVGAIIIKDNEIISKAHNRVIELNDPTAHAEILAIKKACNKLNSRYLNNCEIYITLEPCPMCAGAIMMSRIKKIIYSLDEPNFGSLGGYINLSNHPNFKNVEIYGGIMENEGKKLMTEYFKNLRSNKK